MGKGQCTFKEADITRAFKAARKAGVDVQVVVDLERKMMTLTPVKVDEVNCSGSNPWDEVLDNATDKKRAS
jgi:hypothetical protein